MISLDLVSSYIINISHAFIVHDDSSTRQSVDIFLKPLMSKLHKNGRESTAKISIGLTADSTNNSYVHYYIHYDHVKYLGIF